MRNGEQGWDADFPMREEVEDYADRTRSFVINCHEGGLGFTVRAEEEGRRGAGYQFGAYSETTMVRILVRYEDYTREEVHDLFSPNSTFTPQSGTWGPQGLVSIPDRPGDYVFFVTYGQKQRAYEFDEGVSEDGAL